MKKLNLTALLLGAALFTGIGAVSLSASDMKCGAGKCGGAMEKAEMKCGSGKCGSSMKKGSMKCDKKCDMKMKEEMKKGDKKCGKGKCGGN